MIEPSVPISSDCDFPVRVMEITALDLFPDPVADSTFDLALSLHKKRMRWRFTKVLIPKYLERDRVFGMEVAVLGKDAPVRSYRRISDYQLLGCSDVEFSHWTCEQVWSVYPCGTGATPEAAFLDFYMQLKLAWMDDKLIAV